MRPNYATFTDTPALSEGEMVELKSRTGRIGAEEVIELVDLAAMSTSACIHNMHEVRLNFESDGTIPSEAWQSFLSELATSSTLSDLILDIFGLKTIPSKSEYVKPIIGEIADPLDKITVCGTSLIIAYMTIAHKNRANVASARSGNYVDFDIDPYIIGDLMVAAGIYAAGANDLVDPRRSPFRVTAGDGRYVSEVAKHFIRDMIKDDMRTA